MHRASSDPIPARARASEYKCAFERPGARVSPPSLSIVIPAYREAERLTSMPRALG